MKVDGAFMFPCLSLMKMCSYINICNYSQLLCSVITVLAVVAVMASGY